MKRDAVAVLLLACLFTGCGEEDGAPPETPAPPPGAPSAAEDDGWPGKAVERVRDLLGTESAFDEQRLLAFIKVQREQLAWVGKLQNGEIPPTEFEPGMKKILSEGGFSSAEEFKQLQERVFGARALLLGLSSLELQLDSAEMVPAVSGSVEEQVQNMRKGLMESPRKPTLEELRLVYEHLEELQL